MADIERTVDADGKPVRMKITNTQRGRGHWLFEADSKVPLPDLRLEWRGHSWWIGDYKIEDGDLSGFGAVWVPEGEESK